MNASMIRPGLLIALHSTVRGGVSYQRTDLESNETTARWETLRTMEDPEEHARAVQARGAALSSIRRLCIPTPFGLLCPEDRESDFDAAVAKAQLVRDEHNKSAKATWVDIYVLKGRIASSDEQAARAIAAEMRSLIEQMAAGVETMNPEMIREAASKAKPLAAMLSDEKAEAANTALQAARAAAREIVKRVEKGGEEAAVVLETLDREALSQARMAFLDLSDEPASQPDGEAMPEVSVQRFSGLSLFDENTEEC